MIIATFAAGVRAALSYVERFLDGISGGKGAPSKTDAASHDVSARGL